MASSAEIIQPVMSTPLAMSIAFSPPPDPTAPAVKSQWFERTGGDEAIYARFGRRHFDVAARAGVIVDDHPAAIHEAIPVAIDVPFHFAISVQNEQPDLLRAEFLMHDQSGRGISRNAFDQHRSIAYAFFFRSEERRVGKECRSRWS